MHITMALLLNRDLHTDQIYCNIWKSEITAFK